jgi:hypothetical protein
MTPAGSLHRYEQPDDLGEFWRASVDVELVELLVREEEDQAPWPKSHGAINEPCMQLRRPSCLAYFRQRAVGSFYHARACVVLNFAPAWLVSIETRCIGNATYLLNTKHKANENLLPLFRDTAGNAGCCKSRDMRVLKFKFGMATCVTASV